MARRFWSWRGDWTRSELGYASLGTGRHLSTMTDGGGLVWAKNMVDVCDNRKTGFKADSFKLLDGV